MPLSLFVVQDDNMQSRIVAQAFVCNETTETYQWVLKMTKKATNNRCPHMFVTNGDLAIEYAKRGVPFMTNATTIFSSIESLAKRYLRSNVANFLVEQMKESLYYTASCATVEEIELLTSYEPSQSKDIDNEPDAIVLYIIYLLEHLEETSIMAHIAAQFSLQLIAPCWISKSQRLDAEKKYIHFEHKTEEITNDNFIDEMLFYGKAWGLAHIAVNKCMLHHDNKFILLIKNYLNKIYTREEELVRLQKEVVASTSQNVAKSTEDSMIQLENPQKVVSRKRPKAANYHNKDITNVTLQETSKKKHGQYTCGFCKELGHNIATCLNKP
ncbi:25020_t:CDS:2 [Cetraspora pellucida]|uniref:25020_t:CDS:1 n=1 Tax=Cetraspora pellucida TaxID=1433469 RepID=A0A9N9AMX4_9GLOM|nr:25020_t:CDS:2 [Cetraspora pellucida]